ncbi:MAG: ADP-ribosylglycohydrolase family protein [Ignavibacterium sp.]|nr:ADP-ribosylglycohydrolase family protein [Ignavibacterium sp.]
MVITLQERARGAFIGLAVGDALGSPTEGKTPDEIFARWGRVTDFLTEDQGGSDDTEYALFTAQLLLKKKRELTSENVASAWRKDIVKADNAYKGAGFSEIITIHNLLNGLQTPDTGKHLHSWSDGLAMRVVPFGIASAGDPEFAAYLAKVDGEVSHSGEGIYSGQAVAAAISIAMMGASLEEIIEAALFVIPQYSWTYNSIKRAVQIAYESNDVWSSLNKLHSVISCSYYFWTDIAPEAVGLAFGILTAAKLNFKDSVLGAVNIGRDTDTIAAINGAICGAYHGFQSIPFQWLNRISISKGICINAVKGVNILYVADELALLAESWSKKDE